MCPFGERPDSNPDGSDPNQSDESHWKSIAQQLGAEVQDELPQRAISSAPGQVLRRKRPSTAKPTPPENHWQSLARLLGIQRSATVPEAPARQPREVEPGEDLALSGHAESLTRAEPARRAPAARAADAAASGVGPSLGEATGGPRRRPHSDGSRKAAAAPATERSGQREVRFAPMPEPRELAETGRGTRPAHGERPAKGAGRSRRGRRGRRPRRRQPEVSEELLAKEDQGLPEATEQLDLFEDRAGVVGEPAEFDLAGGVDDEEESFGTTPTQDSVSRDRAEGLADRRARKGHGKIPSWEDAVGVIIAANLEKRSGESSGGAHRRRRGPGGRRRSR